MNKLYKALVPVLFILPALFASCDGITEPQETPSYSISPKSFKSLKKEAHKQTLTISVPGTWTLASNADWVIPSRISGNKGTNIAILVDIKANTEEEVRTAKLTLTIPSIDKTATINVSQLGESEKPAISDPVVEWIYDELCVNYYWNTEVQAASPDFDLPYDAFLDNMLIGLTGAYDVEKSGSKTIDGYYSRNVRYIYSYIEDPVKATRAGDNDYTFGFDISMYLFSNGVNYKLLVSNVLPNGPADVNNIKRGMWITKYNGSPITETVANTLLNDLYRMRVSTMKLTIAGVSEPIELKAGMAEVTPIYRYDVIESPVKKKKVGYFLYNEFEWGDNYKYDNQLKNVVFKEFKDKDVDELVLDLRYNHGGYLESCRVLSSLIANEAGSKSVFAKLLRAEGNTVTNPSTKTQQMYYYSGLTNALNLKRVFVLVTGDSASASEMVVNGLRGTKGDDFVILIGAQTNGKNVGMDRLRTTIDGYRYDMWPITFKLQNAKDFSDYPLGFEPKYAIEELAEVYTGTIYELGDPRERMLKAALTVIDGGTPQVDTRTTRSVEMPKMEIPLLPGRGGAKMVPEDVQ